MRPRNSWTALSTWRKQDTCRLAPGVRFTVNPTAMVTTTSMCTLCGFLTCIHGPDYLSSNAHVIRYLLCAQNDDNFSNILFYRCVRPRWHGLVGVPMSSGHLLLHTGVAWRGHNGNSNTRTTIPLWKLYGMRSLSLPTWSLHRKHYTSPASS